MEGISGVTSMAGNQDMNNIYQMALCHNLREKTVQLNSFYRFHALPRLPVPLKVVSKSSCSCKLWQGSSCTCQWKHVNLEHDCKYFVHHSVLIKELQNTLHVHIPVLAMRISSYFEFCITKAHTLCDSQSWMSWLKL